MAYLTILTAPDPKLKEVSQPVSEVNDEIKTLMRDMLDTMDKDFGVGLAAIQVGIAKQIIVMDLKEDDDEIEKRPPDFYPLFLVNPQITWASEEYSLATEGCLSVPSMRVEVLRPSNIRIQYLNYDGIPSAFEASGWLARAIQHEMDHLQGKLTIDYLSALKKELAMTKLKKLKKQYV